MAERDEAAAAREPAPRVEIPEFRTWLEARLRRAQRDLEEFRGRFEKDPAHALVWGGELALRAAAEAGVVRRVLDAVDQIGSSTSRASLGSIRDYATKEVLRRAENPSRSTSPMARLEHQAEGASWSAIALFLRGEAL